MKIIVDKLPYFGEGCPFDMLSCPYAGDERCPSEWEESIVNGKNNPHECFLLKEMVSDK